MKGTLHKTEQGWMVRYDQRTWQDPSAEDGELHLHPDHIEMMDTCFTSKFSHEVEFEIVTEWGLAFAKLINQSFVDNRKDKLETLARLLAKSWFYGKWDWETPNERVMQMLMQDLGLWPFKNEDEMIQQTRVDEGLYKEAVDKVALRNPRIMPVENHSVKSNEMIDHIGDTNKMVEDDVEKLAKEYANNSSTNNYEDGINVGKYQGFIKGYNKAKETLYTEEQVMQAYEYGSNASLGVSKTNLIQSLKQSKQ